MWAALFFVFLTIQGGKKAKPFEVKLLRGFTITMPAHMAEFVLLAQLQVQVLQNSKS